MEFSVLVSDTNSLVMSVNNGGLLMMFILVTYESINTPPDMVL